MGVWRRGRPSPWEPLRPRLPSASSAADLRAGPQPAAVGGGLHAAPRPYQPAGRRGSRPPSPRRRSPGWGHGSPGRGGRPGSERRLGALSPERVVRAGRRPSGRPGSARGTMRALLPPLLLLACAAHAVSTRASAGPTRGRGGGRSSAGEWEPFLRMRPPQLRSLSAPLRTARSSKTPSARAWAQAALR